LLAFLHFKACSALLAARAACEHRADAKHAQAVRCACGHASGSVRLLALQQCYTAVLSTSKL
jgi:hypothetical protein